MPKAVEIRRPIRSSATTSFTWGQTAIRRSIDWLGEADAYFNMTVVVGVPSGRVSTASAVDAIGNVLAGHLALHSRYRREGSGYENVPFGTVDLSVEVQDRSGWTLAEADAAADVLAAIPFRSDELPVRVLLLTAGGLPEYVVLAVHHQAVDGGAASVLRAAIRAAIAQEPTPEERGLADRRTWELSADGQARSERALRHVATVLGSVGASRLPRRGGHDGGPRFVTLELVSPALGDATVALAERHAVSTSTILLASWVSEIAMRWGRPEVALRLIAANRSARQWRNLVAPMAQNAFFSVDVASGGFEDLLDRVGGAALAAYRHAQYDPDALDRLWDGLGASAPTLGCFFNDARDRPWRASTASEQGGIPGTVRVAATHERLDLELFLQVETGPDDRAVLLLQGDTDVVSREALADVLRGVEGAVIRRAREL